MYSKFSEDMQKVLIEAKKEILDLKHEYIGSEHIFLSLLTFDNSFNRFMDKYGVDYVKYKNKLIELVGIGDSINTYFLYTPLLKKIIEEAILLSREKCSNSVSIEDIVMASFEEEEGIGIKVLYLLGITDDIMDEYYSSSIGKSKTQDKKLFVLDYGIDLTSSKFDPVIGRDNEIKRMMEILCRRYKNNPLLIGPAGVGKTALVYELARRINEGCVPDKLKGMRIISISLSSLVANTKYRGEFEERITKMLKELESVDNVILFIDEIHTIMGAGGAEGAIDAANIFKPALARGNIKLIGATTLDEYRETIEKDKAMERRFQKVDVKEPNIDETLDILKGLKNVYEKHHNVLIDDSILTDIVTLSNKYIHNRYEPDRSIDILDDVCSRVSLVTNKKSIKVREYGNKLVELEKIKNKYLLSDNYRKAYEIKSMEKEIISKLKELDNKNGKVHIRRKDIVEIIANKASIPVEKIKGYTDKDILKLSKYLHSNIMGQDEAIDELVKVTRRMEYFNTTKPVSFLFVGPSGCGKTKLATLYGKYIFNNVIRIDGSEYRERESINKLLGAPSGYVGYDDNKNKLEEVRNNPYSLILFDEIEKACSDVLNLFLQILDEGYITDNRGNVIHFDNCVIIMTSNLGFTQKDIGFVENTNISGEKIKDFMSIELLNRIKSTIYFNKLKYNDIYSILKKEISNIKDNVNTIRFTNDDVNNMIKESNYLEYGARRISSVLEEYIDRHIIDMLAKKALKHIS